MAEAPSSAQADHGPDAPFSRVMCRAELVSPTLSPLVDSLPANSSVHQANTLQVMCCHVRGGVYGDIAPQPLLPISVCCLVCQHVEESLIFWVSFKGNCSVCSYRFSVSVGGQVRNLLCCHFELKLSEGKCSYFLTNNLYYTYENNKISKLNANV